MLVQLPFIGLVWNLGRFLACPLQQPGGQIPQINPNHPVLGDYNKYTHVPQLWHINPYAIPLQKNMSFGACLAKRRFSTGNTSLCRQQLTSYHEKCWLPAGAVNEVHFHGPRATPYTQYPPFFFTVSCRPSTKKGLAFTMENQFSPKIPGKSRYVE